MVEPMEKEVVREGETKEGFRWVIQAMRGEGDFVRTRALWFGWKEDEDKL